MKSLWRNKSAIATVEFALVAPIALLILCLTLESARLQVAALLIQRSIYDLAYRAKTDQDREANFEALAAEVLERRNSGFFRVEEITIKVKSDPDMRYIRDGGTTGSGKGKDIVRLTFEAELGLFPNLVPKPLKVKKTFDYYYINELGA
ncbi:MAG: pilus assembly protein [Deltaproteobacteria bacterium]|jgi:hypothetical protein|nr:pilus assembly protein [Deltaproteobacteria bacterium]